MSLFEDEKPEFIDNPEDRCPVVLLLDNSASMSGDPINELNQGLKIFKQELSKDDLASQRIDIASITFGPVNIRQGFVSVEQFDDSPLSVDHDTPTGDAIDQALDLLESRKDEYRNNNVMYYRPWVILITDGIPTDDWDDAADRVNDFENSKKVSFWTIGVEGADMNTLTKIAPKKRPPLKLKGLQFRELFSWLSSSLTMVSNSQSGDQIDLVPPGWSSFEA